MTRLALLCVCLLFALGSRAKAEPLEPLYARIARDLAQGKPLSIRIHVALCDNDSQGIVPVKNRRICDGDVPAQNLYWATDGGLDRYLRKNGYRLIDSRSDSGGDILIENVWSTHVQAAGGLRARGVTGGFEVRVTAIAYRGSAIERAMRDYLRAVSAPGDGDHVIGYIGHNYLLDVSDAASPSPAQTANLAPRGTFALSCLGEGWIRPRISREGVHILLLNRGLTYPGAWTLGGVVEGLAHGESGRGIQRAATAHFARGKNKPAATLARVFSFGSGADASPATARLE
jgi:hypothetical protein